MIRPAARPVVLGVSLLAAGAGVAAPTAVPSGSEAAAASLIEPVASQAPGAQEPGAAATGQQAGAQAEQILPIPATDIPARADDLNRELARVGLVAEQDLGIATIAAEIPAYEIDVDADYRELDQIDVNTVVLRTIDDLRQKWTEHQRTIARPLDQVTDRYRALQGEIAALGDVRSLWELTLADLGVDVELPEDVRATLLGRTNEALTAIDDAVVGLQARSDQVLQVQSRVSTIDARVSDALQRLDQLGAEVRQQVLSQDSPPIWRFGRADVGQLGGQARDAFSDRIEITRGFFVRNQGPAGAHLATFILFIVIAVGIGRRLRRWEGDAADVESLRLILSRPVSIAAIFALLAGSWFYAAIPTSVVDILLMATVVAVARIAPLLLRPGDLPTLYGLLASYLAVRIVGLLAEGSSLRRFALFVVALVALLGIARFVATRMSRLAEGRGGWFSVAAFFLRLSVPLLLGAVLANLLGWTRLAWVITAGAVSSAYGALIVWLFVVAASGLAAVLPYTLVGDLLPSLRRNADGVARVIRIVAQLTAFWLWFRATLRWFLLYELVTGWADAIAETSLNLGGLEIRTGDVFAAILILIVAPLISRLMRFFFMEEVRPRLSLPRGSADGVASLFHYVVMTIGILLAATAAGFNTTQLTVVAGALGVGIGFGLQNVVSNFISGLILIFERPISVGDRITAGAQQEMGTVTRIGIRASTVRTFDGAEIVVPNSDLITKEVTNWTLTDLQRRLVVTVAIEYGTDPNEILEILSSVAAEHEAILQDPAPNAVFDGFGESSLDFRLLYWVPMEDLLKNKTSVNLAVHAALKEAGVRIAFPRRDLRIKGAGGLAAADGGDIDLGGSLAPPDGERES